MSYLHGVLMYLELFSEISMLHYTIFTPISSITLRFFLFKNDHGIQLFKPKACEQKVFLRPCKSKNLAKEAKITQYEYAMANTNVHDDLDNKHRRVNREWGTGGHHGLFVVAPLPFITQFSLRLFVSCAFQALL